MMIEVPYPSKTEAGCIEIYEDIMPQSAADKLIESFELSETSNLCKAGYSKARMGAGPQSISGGLYRSNQTMALFPHECEDKDCRMTNAVEYLLERYVPCVNHYQSKYEVEIGFDEGFQLLKYSPGNEYKAHSDSGPGHDFRVVSGLILLNPSEYIGGGTYFTNFDTTVKTETPSIILFPSNYAYTHRAKAVLDGIKYAIVTWMGPPWRGPEVHEQ
jgi:hypothetical protein